MGTKIINIKRPIIFLFISLIIFIKCQNNYVYFPLKLKDNTYLKSLNNINDTMKFIYLEPLISDIIIGEPKQKINIIFRTDCTYVYITLKEHQIKKPDLTSEFIKKKYGDFLFYDQKESRSIYDYNIIKNYTYAYDNQFISRLINEKIILNGNNYNINISLGEYIELEESGGFCLQINKHDEKSIDFTSSFPVILKENLNLINNYKWFIYYSQDNKNEYLVLGISPNEFKDPKTGNLIYPNFNKDENYFNINDIPDVKKNGMMFKFDDIYLMKNNKKIEFEDENNFYGKLMPNIGFIVGTSHYKKYIEDSLFSKYLPDKCKKDIFLQRPDLVGQEYTYYYCKESLYDTFKSSFEKIIFKQTSILKEYFELNFNDLFIKQNGYLIFLVIFSTHEHKYWDLGKIFMKKYQFEFDFEKKKIGYYKIQKSNKEPDNPNNTFKYILIIGVIIILSAILIILGIIIGKNYFKNRKKRANELDDDFDYKEKNESIPIINE